MWQLEDIIRVCKLDMDTIYQSIIKGFQLQEKEEKETTAWYESLVDMMHSEGTAESGHLQMLRNTVNDMFDLHKEVFLSNKYQNYNAYYNAAFPLILELKSKQTDSENEIELCLNFLYGILMLRLKKQEITEETAKALDIISKFITQLSIKYKEYKDGQLDL